MAGHQVYEPDSIGTLTKTGANTAQLSASTVTVGGLQYDTATLTVDMTISGFGGLDTGSSATSTVYYIYAVVQAGEAGLVASLSAVSPSGFDASKEIGKVITNSSAELTKPAKLGEQFKQIIQGSGGSGSGTITNHTIDRDDFSALISGPASGVYTANTNCTVSLSHSGGNVGSNSGTGIEINGTLRSSNSHAAAGQEKSTSWSEHLDPTDTIEFTGRGASGVTGSQFVITAVAEYDDVV